MYCITRLFVMTVLKVFFSSCWAVASTVTLRHYEIFHIHIGSMIHDTIMCAQEFHTLVVCLMGL